MPRNSVHTNDGVKLSLIDEGEGQPIILLHGWGQSAALFQHQIDTLKTRYRVIALDFRGHGESDKPDFGNRISRLTKDLDDLIQALELKNIVLLAHSLGCCVAWSYLNLFGSANIAKLICVDQQACIIANPAWSPEEKAVAGSNIAAEHLYAVANAFGGSSGEEMVKKFIRSSFSDKTDEDTLLWVIQENLKPNRQHSAALLLNHMAQDWRDVIRTVKLPTLIITGELSKRLASQQWIRDQIPGARLVVFSQEERGSHFMFLENPALFNQTVLQFLSAETASSA